MWYKWRHLEPSFSSLDAPVGQFWVSVSSSGMENREFSVGQGHRTAASTLGWGESEKSLQPSSLGWPGGQGAASELPEGNKRLKQKEPGLCLPCRWGRGEGSRGVGRCGRVRRSPLSLAGLWGSCSGCSELCVSPRVPCMEPGPPLAPPATGTRFFCSFTSRDSQQG